MPQGCEPGQSGRRTSRTAPANLEASGSPKGRRSAAVRVTAFHLQGSPLWQPSSRLHTQLQSAMKKPNDTGHRQRNHSCHVELCMEASSGKQGTATREVSTQRLQSPHQHLHVLADAKTPARKDADADACVPVEIHAHSFKAKLSRCLLEIFQHGARPSKASQRPGEPALPLTAPGLRWRWEAETAGPGQVTCPEVPEAQLLHGTQDAIGHGRVVHGEACKAPDLSFKHDSPSSSCPAPSCD